MIYVDELAPTTPSGQWPYTQSCHMQADSHEELMAMAQRLNLDPAWIQKPGTLHEHFDLTATRRRLALRYGAQATTRREQAQRLLALKHRSGRV